VSDGEEGCRAKLTPPSQARAAAGARIIRGKVRRHRTALDLSAWESSAPSSSPLRISSFHQLLKHNIQYCYALQHLHIPPLIRTFSSIGLPLQRSRTTPHRQHPASAAYHLASPSSLPALLRAALRPLNLFNFLLLCLISSSPSTKTIRSRQARCRTPQCQESVVRALVPPLIFRDRLARASQDPNTSVPLPVLELVRSRVLRVCQFSQSFQLFNLSCSRIDRRVLADGVILNSFYPRTPTRGLEEIRCQRLQNTRGLRERGRSPCRNYTCSFNVQLR
jgi:hypothetical protein